MKACFFEPLATPLTTAASIHRQNSLTNTKRHRRTPCWWAGRHSRARRKLSDASARVLRSFHTNNRIKNRLFALTDDCWTDVGCVAAVAAALRALDFYAIFPFCLAVLLLFFHPVGFWLQLSSSVLGGELHSLTFVGRPLGCSFCSQMLLLSAWSTQSIQHTRSERV